MSFFDPDPASPGMTDRIETTAKSTVFQDEERLVHIPRGKYAERQH
jgi:hypothetical protein